MLEMRVNDVYAVLSLKRDTVKTPLYGHRHIPDTSLFITNSSELLPVHDMLKDTTGLIRYLNYN